MNFIHLQLIKIKKKKRKKRESERERDTHTHTHIDKQADRCVVLHIQCFYQGSEINKENVCEERKGESERERGNGKES